jgi:aerobic-type carbon monoxide dehydrogenase small subunit (CoxS/CutS family)
MINVNGQERLADVMKQETLAWTLRHKLGLTGTKLGCDRADELEEPAAGLGWILKTKAV